MWSARRNSKTSNTYTSPSLIDFTSGAFRYRLAHLQGRNELIGKAIGFKRGTPLTVFDTTAGLGREAFLLAAMGCDVILFERHPVVAANLKQALIQAQTDPELAPIVARMTFHPQCAIAFLTQTPPSVLPDVIYCDPMFVPRTKSAAVKKELLQLQQLVGQDTDAEQLVSLAKQFAKKRVVVKRALRSPFLCTPPEYSLDARSHRFDIYIQAAVK